MAWPFDANTIKFLCGRDWLGAVDEERLVELPFACLTSDLLRRWNENGGQQSGRKIDVLCIAFKICFVFWGKVWMICLFCTMGLYLKARLGSNTRLFMSIVKVTHNFRESTTEIIHYYIIHICTQVRTVHICNLWMYVTRTLFPGTAHATNSRDCRRLCGRFNLHRSIWHAWLQKEPLTRVTDSS